MSEKKVIQLIIFPHRLVHSNEELDGDIQEPLKILFG
jgi:hypothetical protein